MTLKKLNYSHEAMIDAMIANPAISGGELAAMFGYTEAWISTIRSSDAFREKLAERKTELVNPVVLASVEERFDIITRLAQEKVIHELSKPVQEVSIDVAMQAAALGAKGAGRGGFGSKVQVNVSSPDPQRIDRIADRLRSLNQGVVDVEAREVPAAR